MIGIGVRVRRWAAHDLEPYRLCSAANRSSILGKFTSLFPASIVQYRLVRIRTRNPTMQQVEDMCSAVELAGFKIVPNRLLEDLGQPIGVGVYRSSDTTTISVLWDKKGIVPSAVPMFLPQYGKVVSVSTEYAPSPDYQDELDCPPESAIQLESVREYTENYPVYLSTEGRPTLMAFNEGGYNSTSVDLGDLLQAIRRQAPELLEEFLPYRANPGLTP